MKIEILNAFNSDFEKFKTLQKDFAIEEAEANLEEEELDDELNEINETFENIKTSEDLLNYICLSMSADSFDEVEDEELKYILMNSQILS